MALIAQALPQRIIKNLSFLMFISLLPSYSEFTRKDNVDVLSRIALIEYSLTEPAIFYVK